MTRSARDRSIFERWAYFVAGHGWQTIGAGLLVLVALGVASYLFAGSYSTQFSLPGSNSQKASDLIAKNFPQQSGNQAQIVFYSPNEPVTTPGVQQRVTGIVQEASKLPRVTGVRSPYDQPPLISPDGHYALAFVIFPQNAQDVGQPVIDLAKQSDGNGLTVAVGGGPIEQAQSTGPGPSEAIGISAAAVILLVAFGSVVAMGLPIATALFGLGGALLVLGLVTNLIDIPTFTTAFASMIGIGVGIDYSLLITTRFREQMHRGEPVARSLAVALGTAGRSVLFAGSVVIIALASLALMGIPFVTALGVSAVIVVAFSVVTALTVLAALISVLGRHIDSLSIPFLRSSDARPETSSWYRLSHSIQRHPWFYVVPGVLVLVILAVPFFSMRSAFTDAGNDPAGTETRRAYDLTAQGFGPGYNGPLTIAVEVNGASQAQVNALAQRIKATPGVASVSPPKLNQTGNTAVIMVFPATAPQASATTDLVKTLRNDAIPAATAGTPTKAFVGGQTGGTIDVGSKINSRLPLFFSIVIGLSFVVLMLVFRSLLIPLTAAVMNILSVGAAYGIIVAVFQWGWFGSAIGVSEKGPIEPFMPMLLFAILFGLSMDYEVFLVSRIREEHLRGRPNSEAVALGLSSTGRIITSAALIMIIVFASFILQNQRVIKEFGLGLAAAILLDATIVRLLLVPAIMELLGESNWWIPRWLDRVLPHLEPEGALEVEPARRAA